jgi:hypothetical protein
LRPSFPWLEYIAKLHGYTRMHFRE